MTDYTCHCRPVNVRAALQEIERLRDENKVLRAHVLQHHAAIEAADAEIKRLTAELESQMAISEHRGNQVAIRDVEIRRLCGTTGPGW